ncbi:MAG: transglutaminase domain-containing protein [Lentisphaeria bacterium]|nr:transglutaminase domain-containing protein [Lentisphaeria bacterium]
MYQDISKFSFSTGEIYLFPQDNGKYIYASFDRKQKGTHLIREFDVTLYDIQTDWSKITPSIKPSGTNQIFTKAAGPYIDPNHPKISSIRKSLSKKSKNILEYTRNAYLYTIRNFRYSKPMTGIHTLQQILNDRGGDCGNLSSVFITLLRANKIPARHVVGMRPNGECHIWAEFYLDNAGWIPADVTADLKTESLAHFGKIKADCIVMHKDIFFQIYNGKKMTDLVFLQTYAYWSWSTRKSGKFRCSLKFEGTKIAR